MYIERIEHVINIYPFVNDKKDATFSARITVIPYYDSCNVYVRYVGQDWTEEKFEQLKTAFAEAFKIAKEVKARNANTPEPDQE